MIMTTDTQQWNAPYWKQETHGSAWDRVKESLQRDWEQTKADVNLKSGKELNQQVSNTVKQAAGSEVMPGPNTPNPAHRSPSSDAGTWYDVEPAFRYGAGARAQYSSSYQSWNDELEHKVSRDWDEKKTGKPFKDVKPYVQRAYDFKK
jgi:hypothetical protein